MAAGGAALRSLCGGACGRMEPAALERFASPGKGSGLRSRRRVRPGELLYRAEPFAYVVTKEQLGGVCERCLRRYRREGGRRSRRSRRPRPASAAPSAEAEQRRAAGRGSRRSGRSLSPGAGGVFAGCRRPCAAGAGGLRSGTCRFLPLFFLRAFFKKAFLAGRLSRARGARAEVSWASCPLWAAGGGSAGGGRVLGRCSAAFIAPGWPVAGGGSFRSEAFLRRAGAGAGAARRRRVSCRFGGRRPDLAGGRGGVRGRVEACVTAAVLLRIACFDEDGVLIRCSPARRPRV